MPTNRRRQSRSSSTGLTYDSLESRCVLTGAHQVFVPMPESVNLVHNEAFHTSHESVNGLYDSQAIPGWQAIRLTNVKSEGPIKLTSLPQRGQVLNLDSSRDLDYVYQEVPTEPGRRYLISFDSRQSFGVDQQRAPARSTQVEVYWNGSRIAKIQPGSQWKTNTLEVFGSSGDFSQLTFSENWYGAGDRVGALINRVRVVRSFEVGAVVNGGFELTIDSDPPDRNQPFAHPDTNVPGWNASASPPNSPVINLEPTTGKQRNNPRGARVFNLNAHEGHPGFRDSIFQDLETVPGTLYYVQFQTRGDSSSELRVQWNNKWAMTARPDSRWESIGILLRATSTQTRLRFIEGADSNGDIRLDNIRIHQVVDSPAFTSQYHQKFASANYGMNAEDSLRRRRR